MNVSAIYARFTTASDRLYRQAMVCASRHRFLRCHHLLCAARETDLPQNDEKSSQYNELASFLEQLREMIDTRIKEESAGSLDLPIKNSEAMKQVLLLSSSSRTNDHIYPEQLVLLTLNCWPQEVPNGPIDKWFYDEVSDLMGYYGMRPELPSFQGSNVIQKEGDYDKIPTVKQLHDLIGPPITSDDLIDLYLQIKSEQDSVQRSLLAQKLEYLSKRG